jgi:S1-C subfamily serine protease
MKLEDLSNAIAKQVDAAKDAVVEVHGRWRFPSTGTIWAAEVVVTAAHTLRRESGLAVAGPDGASRPAELLGFHAGADLAVLRVPGLRGAAPRWADAGERVGQIALPLGRRRGGIAAALGMIAGLGPAWTTRRGAEIDRYIDVDGTLPRGFSGGPLVSSDGGFLGINTTALVPGGTTIPTPTVRRVVERLLAHGTAKPGFLGVSVQAVALPPAVATAAGQPAGLLVLATVAGGPAEAGGLGQGDVVLAVDGRPVGESAELQAAISDRGGETVKLRIARAGAVSELSIALGERKRERGCG